jgi:hypothetical protein
MSTEQRLEELYRSVWPRIWHLRNVPHVSLPLFISRTDLYESADLKLMVIGQQTHTWFGMLEKFEEADPVLAVEKIQRYYSAFDLGGKKMGSPFWQAAHDLQSQLFPSVPPNGFIYSNLYPCDQKGDRPRDFLGAELRQLRMVPREIKILGPHAIVFFTGPYYDQEFDEYFTGWKQTDVGNGKWIQRLHHHDLLPERTFRTYHPNHLRLKQKMDWVKDIAELIKSRA